MKAGSLRDQLVFELRVSVAGQAVSWTTGFTDFGQAQRRSETNAVFTIRYRDGIAPNTHRIIWDDRIWDITSATHDEKRTMLTIDCDFSMMVEATDLDSLEREFITGLPLVRPGSN